MTQSLSPLAIDIIELALGYDLATQTREENPFLARSLTLSFVMGNSHHFPAFHKVHSNMVFDYIFYETRERFTILLEKIVRTRLALDTHGKPDFFSFVAHALPNEAARTRDSVVWKEALVFLAASGDTVATDVEGGHVMRVQPRAMPTASHIPGLSAFLLVQSRQLNAIAISSALPPFTTETTATLEIRSTFSSGPVIQSETQLAGCHYLRACIDEALRMVPPISANLWRQQLSNNEESLFIDSHHIPRGTLFGVHVYALTHNATVYPQPFVFKPERWLNYDLSESSEIDEMNVKKLMRESFASFSIGPRNCLGKPLTYLEISLFIAHTLWYYDFEPAPGPLGCGGEGRDRGRRDEFCVKDGFNSSHNGTYSVFRPRESVSLEHDMSTYNMTP